jgi:MFS family permease
MAGGAFGSVMGMALGGLVASHLGWRWSFGAMACFGILLVIVYRLVVTERRLKPLQPVHAGWRLDRALADAVFTEYRHRCSPICVASP